MGLGNLVGLAGISKAKPISNNSSGTLNTLSGKVTARRFDGGKMAKERKRFAGAVGDLRVAETVKDKRTGEVTSQTKVIKKDRLSEIAARIAKKYANKTYSSLERRMTKDHKIDYRDKDGNEVEVKFGSTAEAIRKRKKFITAMTGGDGPTPAEIREQERLQKIRQRENIHYISSQRGMPVFGRERLRQDRLKAASQLTGGNKAAMSVNSEKIQSAQIGANVAAAQGGGASSVETGANAREITASIGLKNDFKDPAMVKKEEEERRELERTDPFLKIAEAERRKRALKEHEEFYKPAAPKRDEDEGEEDKDDEENDNNEDEVVTSEEEPEEEWRKAA